MFTFSTRTMALLGATAATALAATGCGSSDDTSTSTTSTAARTTASAAEVDKAFVSQMIPHHQMAVQMASYAPSNGQRSEIKELGNSIAVSQGGEIQQMQTIARKLGATPAAMPSGASGGMDHSMAGDTGLASAAKTLGLSMNDMGMSMNMAALEKAKPFDRAFIDAMIPHHQGAILMARAQLQKGKDPELKKIATAIVAAQIKEIQQMNSWRKQWYGSASPAGGVPTI